MIRQNDGQYLLSQEFTIKNVTKLVNKVCLQEAKIS